MDSPERNGTRTRHEQSNARHLKGLTENGRAMAAKNVETHVKSSAVMQGGRIRSAWSRSGQASRRICGTSISKWKDSASTECMLIGENRGQTRVGLPECDSMIEHDNMDTNNGT